MNQWYRIHRLYLVCVGWVVSHRLVWIGRYVHGAWILLAGVHDTLRDTEILMRSMLLKRFLKMSRSVTNLLYSAAVRVRFKHFANISSAQYVLCLLNQWAVRAASSPIGDNLPSTPNEIWANSLLQLSHLEKQIPSNHDCIFTFPFFFFFFAKNHYREIVDVRETWPCFFNAFT